MCTFTCPVYVRRALMITLHVLLQLTVPVKKLCAMVALDMQMDLECSDADRLKSRVSRNIILPNINFFLSALKNKSVLFLFGKFYRLYS